MYLALGASFVSLASFLYVYRRNITQQSQDATFELGSLISRLVEQFLTRLIVPIVVWVGPAFIGRPHRWYFCSQRPLIQVLKGRTNHADRSP